MKVLQHSSFASGQTLHVFSAQESGCVGLVVGVWVGSSVGAVVGAVVGKLVGKLVGELVGELVGAFVGEGVMAVKEQPKLSTHALQVLVAST